MTRPLEEELARALDAGDVFDAFARRQAGGTRIIFHLPGLSLPSTGLTIWRDELLPDRYAFGAAPHGVLQVTLVAAGTSRIIEGEREEPLTPGSGVHLFGLAVSQMASLVTVWRGPRAWLRGRRHLREGPPLRGHLEILAAWQGWLAVQPEAVLAGTQTAHPILWLELGRVWERLGEWEPSKLCLARQRDARTPAWARLDATVRLARLLLRSGQPLEALRVAEQAERERYRDFVMLGHLGLQRARALACLRVFEEAEAAGMASLRRAWASASLRLAVSSTLFLTRLHTRRLRPDRAIALGAVSSFRTLAGPLFPDKARRLWLAARYTRRARPLALASPPIRDEIARIAVVRLDRLGDIVSCLPAFRLLRESYPQAAITGWVSEGLEFVLEHSGHCNRVLGVNRKDRKAFRRARAEFLRMPHDLVLDLLDPERGWQLDFLHGCRAKYRLGFDTPSRKWHCNLRVPLPPGRMHLCDQAVRLLSALGIRPPEGAPILPGLTLSPDVASRADAILSGVERNGPVVALHPGSGYRFKYWPAEKFAALADRLASARGAGILLLAGPEEGAMAQEIAARAAVPVALPTTPTLADLASVIARCDLFVGLDSGPMHLAGALGTPIVAIWGAGDLQMFGPRWPDSRVVTHGAICACCPQEGNPVRCAMGYTRETAICVAPITADEVFEAASGLLEATRGPRVDPLRTRDPG